MSEKSHVSMEQRICPACGNPYDTGALILDKRLHKSMEPHTVTGLGDLCDKCKGQIADGRVILVVIDEEKTKSNAKDPNNPTAMEVYRMGEIIYMKQEAFSRVFNTSVPPKGFCWISNEVSVALKTMMPKEGEKPS